MIVLIFRLVVIRPLSALNFYEAPVQPQSRLGIERYSADNMHGAEPVCRRGGRLEMIA